MATPKPARAVRALMAALLLLAFLPGCAAYMAFTMPGPAGDEHIEPGMTRGEVEAALPSGPAGQYDNRGVTEVRYEYDDGPPGWSKLRGILYLGADFFTLFLSELIFWPVELYSGTQIERIGVAGYEPGGKLLSWQVRRKDGGEVLLTKRIWEYEKELARARGQGPIQPSQTPLGANALMLAPASVTTRSQMVEFEVTIPDVERFEEIRVDGDLVRANADGTLLVRRAVPVGSSTITVTATDHQAGGLSQHVQVERLPPDVAASPPLAGGSNHALVIGNDRYRSMPPLRTARADARAIAELLGSRYGYEVRLLLDATRAQIVSALASYRNTLAEDDRLLVYYAGHGVNDEEEDHGYWLPVNARLDDPAEWVANANVTRQLKAIRARHVMVIADSCYSGTLTRGITVRKRSADYLQELASRRSRTALTSGGIEPVVDAGGDGNHSVFASALLRELQANQGVLEASVLFRNVSRRVALAADQEPQYAPIVKAGHDDGEFLFVAP